MSLDERRRARLSTPPVPLTWEVPATIGVLGLSLVVMTPLVVQTLVVLLVAGTAVWPPILPGLGGLARGEFGHGLDPPTAAALPPDVAMWVLTVIAAALVIASIAVLALWGRDVTGNSASRGLATSAQAKQALGLNQLRSKAAVIRPDLARQRRPKENQR